MGYGQDCPNCDRFWDGQHCRGCGFTFEDQAPEPAAVVLPLREPPGVPATRTPQEFSARLRALAAHARHSRRDPAA